MNQEFGWGRIKSEMHIRNANGISYCVENVVGGISYYAVLFRNLRRRREVRAGYLNLQVITMIFFKMKENKILK